MFSLLPTGSQSPNSVSQKLVSLKTKLKPNGLQIILIQRLIKAQEEWEREFGSAGASAEQQEYLNSRVFNDGNTERAEACNFIVKRSFSLQRIEQSLLGEKIYATSEMNSINHFVQHHSKDLVVFDVDDTLITTIYPFFDVHVLLNTTLHQRLQTVNADVQDDFFLNLFIQTRPWAIIEDQTPQLIANLQSRGVKVIALTALAPTVKKDLAIDTPSWRVKHLRTLGYDFSKSFLIPLLYGFHGENSQNRLEPYFKDGVLLSGNVSKGEALRSFLRTISFKPKSLLFIDDNLDYIRSVYRELNCAGIECHCILYTRMRKYPANSMFSKDVYRNYLQKQEELIEELLCMEEKKLFIKSFFDTDLKVDKSFIPNLTNMTNEEADIKEMDKDNRILPMVFSSLKGESNSNTVKTHENFLGLKTGFLLNKV